MITSQPIVASKSLRVPGALADCPLTLIPIAPDLPRDVVCALLSPRGRYVAIALPDCEIWILDGALNWSRVHILQTEGWPATALHWYVDPNMKGSEALFCGTSGGVVSLYRFSEDSTYIARVWERQLAGGINVFVQKGSELIVVHRNDVSRAWLPPIEETVPSPALPRFFSVFQFSPGHHEVVEAFFYDEIPSDGHGTIVVMLSKVRWYKLRQCRTGLEMIASGPVPPYHATAAVSPSLRTMGLVERDSMVLSRSGTRISFEKDLEGTFLSGRFVHLDDSRLILGTMAGTLLMVEHDETHHTVGQYVLSRPDAELRPLHARAGHLETTAIVQEVSPSGPKLFLLVNTRRLFGGSGFNRSDVVRFTIHIAAFFLLAAWEFGIMCIIAVLEAFDLMFLVFNLRDVPE
ncbi:hypothetical protein CC1G_04098 [Coprinopsis cinerea okayama7|uniref:Uncharacterized protein n=1 Tax=Coprinopsis cinerea (strain Okayama-7 / 130 / ATCC MYA-4618 / FGSC 9003) TaxID=240176 RepID=A8NVZ1_COPC7|nr:hypothetical protein CC1G_04098 [Coprinopsis cinerea okayama7\|eukprot:XP_001836785.2 hypothetical protein CC1G_04098 [Coprinopsis cinerea okayama7\